MAGPRQWWDQQWPPDPMLPLWAEHSDMGLRWPNSRQRLSQLHCEALAFTQGKRCLSPSSEGTLVVAVVPIGCNGSHYGTATPLGIRQFRIELLLNCDKLGKRDMYAP